ncbi:MAG: LysM peptidoglycan-binding domain-containing protein [Prevotella sp.]|nr:LysM peptidoglycan-binding domain-containing protein [Prevotella sp.]
MKRLFRYFFVSAMLILTCGTITAQSVKTHKVKKGETIYGIAHAYGLTEAELRSANPGMENPGYLLKKGDKILIPVNQNPQQTMTTQATDDVQQRPIRMGVMLPLHDKNNEGKRMVEYYRGLLLGCDSLKHEGISVDVYAWNTPDDEDVSSVLSKPEAAQCDIIFGPLYSKQMYAISSFCQQHGIMLVIPFSINAPQLYSNSHIFQVYQDPEGLNESTSRRFVEWFKDYHPVIVDCADPNSTKGGFTAAVRQQLESRNVKYSLTSIKSANNLFSSAFSTQHTNVVILNSARADDLKVLFIKLRDVLSANAEVKVCIFGYTEWMDLAMSQENNFHRYEMYIPAPFYTNLTQPASLGLAMKYRNNFKQDMISFTPRLALTGFDHVLFFLRGLHKYGKNFDGAAGRFSYQPLQTPLKFEHLSGGGYQNRAFMFVHYKTNGQIETINY